MIEKTLLQVMLSLAIEVMANEGLLNLGRTQPGLPSQTTHQNLLNYMQYFGPGAVDWQTICSMHAAFKFVLLYDTANIY